jgi:hypothetical protein
MTRDRGGQHFAGVECCAAKARWSTDVNARIWHAPGGKVESTTGDVRPSHDDRDEAQAEPEPVESELGVERFQGHGFIRRGNERLTETDYDVIVTPAELRGTGLTYEAGSPLDRAPKPGPDISGRLLGPFFQAQEFAEQIHTLVLEDGREFDFRVIQPDTNEIVGVSMLRSPDVRERSDT